MSAQQWEPGDTHPDAPWTVKDKPLACPTCGVVGRQGSGLSRVDIVDAVAVHWCADHAPDHLRWSDGADS